MAGPCTLLVDPGNQQYHDADGVHDLPWHETPFVKFRVSKRSGSLSFDQPEERWAYCTRTNLDAVPVELLNAVTAFNSNTQSMLTAANATKSTVFITNVISYLATNFAALADQQFWQVLGTPYAHGTGHLGTSWVTKLVSTGGDVTLTTPANGDLATYGSFWYGAAIIINASANARDVRMISTGANAYYTLPGTIPANSYATIRAAGPPFLTGEPVGVKVLGTLAGETFYVIQMGVVGDRTGDPFGPMVFTTSSDIPDTLFYDPNNLDPIDVFSGTNFESQGRMGETFWHVPLTKAHIPDDQHFTVVSRSHPVYLPFTDYPSYYWAITRMEEMHNVVAGGVDIGIYQRGVSTSDLNQGSSLSFALRSGPSDVSAGGTLAGLANPVRQTSPFTSAFTLDGEVVYLRQSNVVSSAFASLTAPEPGWMEIGSESYSDLLLVPGAYTNAGLGSYVMSREHAIFDRELTDAEYAFLDDRDSLWTFNMFAEPKMASVLNVTNWTRGDTEFVPIQILDGDGAPLSIAGHTVWMTFKSQNDKASNDNSAVIDAFIVVGNDGVATSASHLSVVDAAHGNLLMTVAAADSDSFVPGEPLRWDIQVKDISGHIHTIAKGAVTIDADVTRRVVTP